MPMGQVTPVAGATIIFIFIFVLICSWIDPCRGPVARLKKCGMKYNCIKVDVERRKRSRPADNLLPRRGYVVEPSNRAIQSKKVNLVWGEGVYTQEERRA